MTSIQPVMVRYHPGNTNTREVVLFVPDMDVNLGNIMCYAHVGQHSEASMEYYRETIPLLAAPLRFHAEGRELLREYAALCELHGYKLKVVARDTDTFRRQRWAGANRKAGL